MRRTAARVLLSAVLLAAALLPTSAATGQGGCRFPDGRGAAGTLATNGDSWLFRFDPPAIAVGQVFAVELQPCNPGLELQAVDAVMPEHRHGMNYIPRLVRLPAGYWRAERMLFHMPGHWRLLLSWRSPGGRLEARVDLTVQ